MALTDDQREKLKKVIRLIDEGSSGNKQSLIAGSNILIKLLFDDACNSVTLFGEELKQVSEKLNTELY